MFKLPLSCICLFVAASTITCQVVLPAAPLVSTGTSSQYRSQDNVGNYAFGYNEDGLTGGTFRRESGNAAGQVVGSYGLRTADGRLRTVNYIADDGGFRAAINTNEPGVEPKDPASVTINKPTIVAAAPIAPIYAAPAAPIVQAPAAPIVQAPAAPIIEARSPAPIIQASAPIWSPPAIVQQAAPIAYNPYAPVASLISSAPTSIVTSSSWSSPYTISNVAVAPATWGYTLGLPPTFGYTIRKK